MTIRAVQSRDNRRTSYERFADRYPDFILTLGDLRHYRDRELKKLRALPRSGQRDRVRKLLRSERLALLYAYEAMRRVRPLHRVAPEDIHALAGRCDPFLRTIEGVKRLTVPAGHRDRIVQSFGPLKRLHQMMVADVLVNLHPPREEQSLFNGGMPTALKAIEAAFREGFTHAVEVDFTDFYGSVRHERLAGMLHPLPASVTDNVVWDFACRRGPDDEIALPLCEDHPSLSGLVGLSLGAATSPIVGERIIGLLLDIAQPGKVVTYADNLLVLGRDEEEVMARAEHLRECASRLEAGPLRLRIGDASSFLHTQGVEFAKQWARHIRHRLDWSPGWQKRAEHCVADAIDRPTMDQIDAAERKVIQWRRSYPLWRTGDSWLRDRLAELATIRYYRDASPEHHTAAQLAVTVAFIASSDHVDVADVIPDGHTRAELDRRQRLICDARSLVEQIRSAGQTAAA